MKVFISYRHKDRAWAQKVLSAITDPKLDIYADWVSQVGGTDWKAQVINRLTASDVLLVLWSKQAAELDNWAEHERELFRASDLIYGSRGKKIVYLPIDAEKTPDDHHHRIDTLREAVAKSNEPDHVVPEAWQAVRAEVLRAIYGDAGVTFVETVVLAATGGDWIDQLGPDAHGELKAIIAGLNLKGRLADRYGQTSMDWKPYGVESIGEILKNLEVKANDIGGAKLRFADASKEILSADPQSAERKALMLSRKLALIIVDPLSLFSQPVLRRLRAMSSCFRSPLNAFAVLAPQSSDDDALNTVIDAYANELFRFFFAPVAEPNVPSVGLHVRNSRELLRVMLLAVTRDRSRVRGDVAIPSNPILELN